MFAALAASSVSTSQNGNTCEQMVIRYPGMRIVLSPVMKGAISSLERKISSL